MSNHEQKQSGWTTAFLASLLVVPLVVYVGSYFALVRPGKTKLALVEIDLRIVNWPVADEYRFLDSEVGSQVFWPLEQIDRKLRPKVWVPDFIRAQFYGTSEDDASQ